MKTLMSDTLPATARLPFLVLAMIMSSISQTLYAAQSPPQETELEEVVVTGSILRRTDAEAPSPVTVLTAEALEERGINTMAEAMQRLPSNNAGTISAGWNTGFNFASGATAPALRGLTVQSTLSIFDGQRMAAYPLADDGQRNFVDLSTIPSVIIERIEVLRDGASSTYGADAIAGVINVITKKEIQGLHFGGSGGLSQRGDSDEQRFDVTYGFGDLQADGYNFYVSGEYQNQGALRARDRKYPFNTQNWTQTCNDAGSCLHNLNWNGVSREAGTSAAAFNGLFSIPGVTLVRPVTTVGSATGAGRFQFLNAAAGCREFPTVSIAATMSPTSPLSTCEVDFQNKYIMLQPKIERLGLSLRFTKSINDNAQFYMAGNFYKTDTFASFTPLGFNGLPPPPRPLTLGSYNVILPVYICSSGVGTRTGTGTGCDATNGTLNPNNPFAAAGQAAQALLRSPFDRSVDTSSESVRTAIGLEGSFADDWRYSGTFTVSQVGLTRKQNNYLIPQRIMDVVARGTFNFREPTATPQEVWDYISPQSSVYSPSKLWQLQGTIAKDLLSLPGGPLQAAVGASYREESINAPSSNPGADSAPYTRYYSINAVSAKGSRNVKSAFFELNAPVLNSFELAASGRFDDYSTGQSNFSPKLGFKVTPIEQLALRGTWSKGFRIPSFNEAFGLPTTGYVTRRLDCVKYATFCAAHNSNSYAAGQNNLGLTQIGNSSLDPEKSTSYTTGLVFEPIKNVSMTLDYWHIKVKGLITGITDTSAVEDAYYRNNGIVSIPGFTVVPGIPDQAFPNALPVLGFIESPYKNQDSQSVSGVDLGANVSVPLGSGISMRNTLDVSYLTKYELRTDTGDTLRYDGTLSPCNVTSCSGSPKWRASLQTSLDYRDTTASLTWYYTSGYDTTSVDLGGVRGDCQSNADNAASTVAYIDGSPFACKTSPAWNADLTVRHKLNDRVTLNADILNVFDIMPKFDPASAYGSFGFNPAWSGPNVMGRYFRIGAKLDF
jgi:iron complex outermembrane recepter protein